VFKKNLGKSLDSKNFKKNFKQSVDSKSKSKDYWIFNAPLIESKIEKELYINNNKIQLTEEKMKKLSPSK
jgi:hypothetical protein